MSIAINVNSEIGPLQTVLVHTPGQEIENMTPLTAAEVLYDDILNLELAAEEHRQLKGVLKTVCRTLELDDLLTEVLEDGQISEALVQALCELFESPEVRDDLLALSASDLARQLIQGTPAKAISLEKFLRESRYAIPPLPNAFFTRDAAMCVNDRVIIGSMAYRARVAEALLLKTVFSRHPEIGLPDFYFDGTDNRNAEVTIEGGDLLVIREDEILAVIQ